mgnify:CR=1 FL=1
MRNTNVKNEKGITLIVLVITVVILFILSLLIVDFTVDGKLFKTANELGTKGEAQQTETETLRNSWKDMLGLTNTTTNNNTTGNTTGDNTTGGETTCEHTSTTATDNGDGTHTITCTNCGKDIKTEHHTYVGGKCTICQSELVVGAKIDYHEYIGTDGNALSTMPSYTSLKTTRGSTDSSDSDATYSVVNNSGIEWIVLGGEGNQIKITTKNIVQPVSGGYTKSGFTYLTLQGQTGYTNFVNELNKIGAIYGQGKYADKTKFTTSGGRSFKMEDLGYGALTRTALYTYALETHSGDTEAKVYCYEANIAPDGTSTTGGKYSTFKYMALDASNSTQETEASYTWNELTESNPSVTLYQYAYSGSRTLDTSVSHADTKYWLASRYLSFLTNRVNFNAYLDSSDKLVDYDLYNSDDSSYFSGDSGVRPVVYLQTGIKLSYDSTNGYTISQ